MVLVPDSCRATCGSALEMHGGRLVPVAKMLTVVHVQQPLHSFFVSTLAVAFWPERRVCWRQHQRIERRAFAYDCDLRFPSPAQSPLLMR